MARGLGGSAAEDGGGELEGVTGQGRDLTPVLDAFGIARKRLAISSVRSICPELIAKEGKGMGLELRGRVGKKGDEGLLLIRVVHLVGGGNLANFCCRGQRKPPVLLPLSIFVSLLEWQGLNLSLNLV